MTWLALVATALAAFGLGWLACSRRVRPAHQAALADRDMWRDLADSLHRENGQLRGQLGSSQLLGTKAPQAPAAKPISRQLSGHAEAFDDLTARSEFGDSTPPRRQPEASGEAVNALGELRAKHCVAQYELARRLGVTQSDVNTIEVTPLRLLELSTVVSVVEAMGCRLVAQHVDGEAFRLSDEVQP